MRKLDQYQRRPPPKPYRNRQLILGMGRVARLAKDRCSADAVVIAVIDPAAERLVFVGTSGTSPSYRRRFGYIPLQYCFRERQVMRRRRGHIVDDIRKYRHLIDRESLREGIRSYICAPLIDRRQPFGVMYAASYKPDAFGQREIGDWEKVTGALAPIVGNLIDLARATERAASDRRTMEAIAQISDDQGLRRAVRSLAADVVQLVGVDACGIAVVEPSRRIRFLGSYGAGPLFLRNYAGVMAGKDAPLEQILSRSPLRRHYLIRDTRASRLVDDRVIRGGILSLACIPLRVSGLGCLGFMYVGNKVPTPPTDQQISMALEFSSQAASALAVYGLVRRRRSSEAIASAMAAHLHSSLVMPLQTIRGAFESIREGSPDAELLGFADDAIRVAAANVEKLNLLARSQARQIPISPADFRILSLCQETVQAHTPFAQRKGIELLWVVDDSVVHADRDAVRIVLTSLLENALKYTTNGGKVTVHTAPGADVGMAGGCVLYVTDNGIGIPASEIPAILQPYARIRPSPDAIRNGVTDEGLGSGLALVEALLTEMGSWLIISSEPGKGSKFGFWLPDSDTISKPRRTQDADAARPTDR